MEKAVVTGGAGFIGSHLVDELLAREVEVLVIDNLATGQANNLAEAGRTYPARLRVLDLDIADGRAKEEVLRFRPEVVFHLAAQVNVRYSVRDPVFDAQTNVVGTVNMLEAASRSAARSFVFASTGGAIYGEQDSFPADERHATKPKCPYGVAKRAAELYLEYYARTAAMTVVALRYANVYGPRQNSKGEAGVVAIFADRLAAGETLLINGDGEQTRDYVYVSDVVSANLIAAERISSLGFSVYNVGRGVETSVLDIVEEMRVIWQELHGDDASFRVAHGPEMPGEQRRSVIDSRKLREGFGWAPKVELAEGLRATLSSVRGSGRC